MLSVRNKKCGIYFLLNKGHVIYIGQTIDLYTRMGKHDSQSMPYDCMRFISCPNDLLDYYETRWIKRFLPSENKTHKGRKKQKSRYIKSDRIIKRRFPKINDRDMKFRKLTKKSIYGFGSLRDTTVEELILRKNKPNEAVWIYYSLSHISYVDELLEELKIVGDWTIEKPGVNIEKGKAFLTEFYNEYQVERERRLRKSFDKHSKNVIKHDLFANNSKTYNMVRNRKSK